MPAWLSLASLKIIGIAVVLLATFLSGIKIESWKNAAKIAKMQQDTILRERGMNNAREKIEQNAQVIEQKYKKSLAAANSDRDGLRDLIAKFNAMPSSATSSGRTNATGDGIRLLARASELAHEGVQLVAGADSVADRATQAAESCRSKLISLQEYVAKVTFYAQR